MKLQIYIYFQRYLYCLRTKNLSCYGIFVNYVYILKLNVSEEIQLVCIGTNDIWKSRERYVLSEFCLKSKVT